MGSLLHYLSNATLPVLSFGLLRTCPGLRIDPGRPRKRRSHRLRCARGGVVRNGCGERAGLDSCSIGELRPSDNFKGPAGGMKFRPCSWLSFTVAGTSRSAIWIVLVHLPLA